ncbi:MAG: acyl-CoA/acyl-ACP dehydrogenase, partial [Deltaproteobacteria bacterium]
MDFQFNEEQELFKNSFRDFVKNECPTTVLRELEESENGYSPDMWRKMAELGWMGLSLPEEYGGAGADFIALCILCEEMGRGLLPSPYFTSVILCGQLILDYGSEQQKTDLLPKIATGETIVSLALLEPDGNYKASSINTTAQLKGSDYVLKGTKLFVDYAHAADYFICAAVTKKGKNKEAGITLFLVDAKS